MLSLFYLLLTFVSIVMGDSNSTQNDYKWDVTEWSAGCARSGCYYGFKISGPATDKPVKIPAFSASCLGFAEGAPFKPCEIKSSTGDIKSLGLASHLEATEVSGTGAHIAVSFRFPDVTQSGAYFNYTGFATSKYNQFSAPLQNFTITPSEFTSVA